MGVDRRMDIEMDGMMDEGKERGMKEWLGWIVQNIDGWTV